MLTKACRKKGKQVFLKNTDFYLILGTFCTKIENFIKKFILMHISLEPQ